jgi:hypothetical protein
MLAFADSIESEPEKHFMVNAFSNRTGLWNYFAYMVKKKIGSYTFIQEYDIYYLQ